MYSNSSGLKYFKKLRVYKNSTGSNVYSIDKKEAVSYNWWTYFKVINGKNVFNGYSYSVTTSGHQNRMLSLLNQLGKKIDLYIEAPRGLNNLDCALEYNVSKYFQARLKYAKARKIHTKQWHKQDQENALQAIQFIKGHASFIESLRFLVYQHGEKF